MLLRQKGKWIEARSEKYNYNFNVENGLFMRWGEKPEDNPPYGPPELADIELSTICSGIGGGPCKWCYKSNTPRGENMSFETFRDIFDKLPLTLRQIAFGIGDIDANPDLWKIMDYCRTNHRNFVVPNITINGWNLTDEYADRLASLCGSIAVSRYNPKDVCYDAIKELTDRGMKQVNIHMLLAEETYDECFRVIDDCGSDSRLEKLNAVVFLALKERGKRNRMHSLRDYERYRKLVEYAFERKVVVGFDSCSAPNFLQAMKDSSGFAKYQEVAEACESLLFSIYCDVRGNVYPCSFLEEEEHKIANLTEIVDFFGEVWFNDKAKAWRKKLLDTNSKCSHLGDDCRMCPVYNMYEWSGNGKENGIKS